MDHTSYTVLIVDDSPEDRAAFVRFLSRDPLHRYHCVEAATAHDAIEQCRTTHFDCVILDQYLPDMQGVDLLKSLIDEHGILRFASVMVTGSGNEAVAVTAMKHGAQDYLIKAAATPLELRRVINNAIDRVGLQRELERQRTQVSIMLESITDAFFALDHAWHFTFVNKAAEILLRRSDSDLLGKNIWQEFPEAVNTTFYHEYQRAVREQTVVIFEEFYSPLDAWFEVRAYPAPSGLSVYFQNINERKNSDLLIRSSQEQLARIFESTSEGLAILNLDGKITLANAAAEHILGLTRSMITTHYYNDAVWNLSDLQGNPFPDSEIPFAKVIATGKPIYNSEFTTTHADGRFVMLSVNAVPLNDANGQLEGVVTSFRDITARKRAEAQIRLQAQELQTLVENIPDIIIRFDRELRHLFVSPEIERVTGIPSHALIGKTNRDFAIPLHLREQWDAALYDVFGSGTANTIEFSAILGKNVTHFQSRLVPETDPAGVVQSVLSVTRNITERKEAEYTLQFLAKASDALAASLDLDQTYNTVTTIAVPDFGDIVAIDLLQSDGTLRVHHVGCINQDDPAFITPIHHLLNHEYAQNVRLAVAQSGKSLLFNGISQGDEADFLNTVMQSVSDFDSAVIVPLVARGSSFGVLSLARTKDRAPFSYRDQVLAEELASRVAVALDNAQLYRTAQDALRERDAFLSVASHEIRNPLTSLLGRVDLLLRRAQRTGMDERNVSDIRIIGEQGKRINTLLTDLLHVSRLDAADWHLNLNELDVVSLLQRVVAEVAPLSVMHEIKLVLKRDQICMRGDSVRLEQVFRNLLNNAIKYSPNGGVIRVSIGANNEWATIDVQDQGLGIDPAVQAHIFDRFYRVDSKATQHIGGSGIGLYVVKTLVNAHGGSISVNSTVGEGSTFTVKLPILGEQRTKSKEQSI